MTTLAVLQAELALLKARVDALEQGRGAAPSSGNGGGDTLPEHMLTKSWADKKISKDPKQWKGPTQVGKTYSRAPVEWLEMAANNADFKAQKGREENPVRLRNDGKPWHESDTFEAKLLRTWAKRRAAMPQPVKAAPPPLPVEPSDADEDFPFGANAADADIGF